MSSTNPTVTDDSAALSASQKDFSDHTKETVGSGKRPRDRFARKPRATPSSASADDSKSESVPRPDPSSRDAQTADTMGGESAQTGGTPSTLPDEDVESKILQRAKDKHDEALQLLKDNPGSWQAYSKWLTAYRNEIRTKSVKAKLSGAQIGILTNRYDIHARKGIKTVPGIGFYKIKVTVDFYCVLACRPTPKGGWTLDKEQLDFLSDYGLYPPSS